MRNEIEVREILTGLVNERLTIRQMLSRTFTDSDDLQQLGLDSLDIVELWMEAEEKFGCSLDEEQVRAASNFGELVALIMRN